VQFASGLQEGRHRACAISLTDEDVPEPWVPGSRFAGPGMTPVVGAGSPTPAGGVPALIRPRRGHLLPMGEGIGRRLAAFLLAACLAAPGTAAAIEVAGGTCDELVAGGRPFRIVFQTGLETRVEPADDNDVVLEENLLPDGRKLQNRWIAGIFPLSNPAGEFVYDHSPRGRFLLVPGLGISADFTFKPREGQVSRHKLVATTTNTGAVTLGDCRVDVVLIRLEREGPDRQRAVIVRTHVPALRFFLASETTTTDADGRQRTTKLEAVRIELEPPLRR
jgi:hypothetical protein